MAGVLQRFEHRLETVVTGAFARAFRSAVQPVEIAAALQREIDNGVQVLSRDRRLAPNTFTVELSPPDHERLTPFGGTLSDELAILVKEHVTEQRYTLAGPLRIDFVQVPELGTGRFRVRSRTDAAVTPVQGQSVTDSAVRASDVVIEVNGLKHPLTPPGIVLGRGSDSDLRIDDPGVSRRHARISVNETPNGTVVTVTDLGSTNGVVLNGHRVSTASVADGSEIRIGNTSVVIRVKKVED